MRIESTKRLRDQNLLITDCIALPEGRYVHTGVGLGPSGGKPIGFVDSEPRRRFSVVTAPRYILQINGLQIDQHIEAGRNTPQEDKGAKRRVTPGAADEALSDATKKIMKGAVGVSVTHAIQKGGAAVATPWVVDTLGASGDAGASAVIGKILRDSEAAANISMLGNIVKALIALVTLFGLSFTILKLFFDKEVPAWAWIGSSLVNVFLVALFSMYLFDYGPFQPRP